MQSQLVLHPQASRLLAVYSAGFHLVAGIAVQQADLPEIFQLLLVSLLLCSWFWYLLTKGKHHPSEIVLCANGYAALGVGQGSLQELSSLQGELLLPYLIIMRAKLQTGEKYRLILLADSLDHDSLRQCRLWLQQIMIDQSGAHNCQG